MPQARTLGLLVTALALIACANERSPDMDELVREYLFLELSMGNIDGGHVDAYFGPGDIKTQADQAGLSLDEIRARAAALDKSLAGIAAEQPLEKNRIQGLRARLRSLDARISINQEDTVSFDEESNLLFGTTAPTFDATHFDAILNEIDALLPGEGPLSARVDAFENQFAIPIDRLADVFDAAIEECRRRTVQHIELPEGESCSVEYVNDKPWSGYNWYQGNSISLIQVNTDLPIFISRAIDLGCHEGYPGHHTYNALLEKNLVDGEGWLEYTLYPLFSPQSVLAEGSGNYGVQLAFPGEERAQYEKDVLFPLAGLDPEKAALYYELQSLKKQLNYAGNEAARGYLNGDMTREQAVDWLTRYALSSKARAEQRTRFFDTYRSYVINYNHGMDLVADYVERGNASDAERWKKFEAMLSSPLLPEDLQ
ncbi:MAG: hypothetical protein K0U72_11350 [Gammaproteobacteria bacterium]|nr:hypothetical protein [Gammaproteobacteria bacterium]